MAHPMRFVLSNLVHPCMHEQLSMACREISVAPIAVVCFWNKQPIALICKEKNKRERGKKGGGVCPLASCWKCMSMAAFGHPWKMCSLLYLPALNSRGLTNGEEGEGTATFSLLIFLPRTAHQGDHQASETSASDLIRITRNAFFPIHLITFQQSIGMFAGTNPWS